VFDFNGKTIAITGGTRGIGLTIAKKFVSAGANVFVGARHRGNSLGDIPFVATDVKKLSDVYTLAEAALAETGSLDAFINCAGISVWRSVSSVDEKFWDDIVDTNLKGCFWGCKVAAECMAFGGVIINVASLAGKRGSKNNSVYCASKFGVVGLTQALAKELGERGIRVNSVCPVYVKTEELLKNLSGEHPEIGNEDPEVFLDKFAYSSTALGRIPTADEVADTCLYLASPSASAITGQNINVDCGVLPQ
jgi:NAD(P)-dependent dehydrogenase (short-subunit alcohol dehydrogenase family)